MWSDLNYHAWLRDRDSLSLPLLLLPLHRLSHFCKVVWLCKWEILNEIDEIVGRCDIFHSVFTHYSDQRMRRLSKVKNGLSLVVLLPIKEEISDAVAAVFAAVSVMVTGTKNMKMERKGKW